jgi:fatty-acyl-CoA synthase
MRSRRFERWRTSRRSSDALAERLDAESTYEVLRRAAREHGTAPRPLPGEGTPDEDAVVVTYTELLRRVTQTANLFAALGVERDDVVSYVLLNLPRHTTRSGARRRRDRDRDQSFLEPGTIRDLLDAARARLLVTLAPAPGFDLFEKVAAIADEVASLQAILCVDPSRYLGAPARALPVATPGGKPILSFDTLRAEQPADRLRGGRRIRPDDVAALFHTGGTTGTPKLARHTHGNQVFASWVMAGCLGSARRRMLVRLPLFHVSTFFSRRLALFQAGASVYSSPARLPHPRAREHLKLVSRHRVTLNGVPTIYPPWSRSATRDSARCVMQAAEQPRWRPTWRDASRVHRRRDRRRLGSAKALPELAQPPAGERRISSIRLRVRIRR